MGSSDFPDDFPDTTSEPSETSERPNYRKRSNKLPNSLALGATVAGARWVVGHPRHTLLPPLAAV